MTLQKLIYDLGQLFPLPQAEDFDNVGLLCGNPDREINGILIAHDALENVVDEAIARNVNLIVCFHPIIFSGLKKITGKNYVERTILKALENKIAIYAVHTVFDNDPKGVNAEICNQLQLKNQQILMPKQQNLLQMHTYVPAKNAEAVRNALFAAGAGNIGDYDECSFTLSGTGTFRPLPGSDPYSGEVGLRERAEEEMISVIFENYKKNKILAALKEAHPYEEVAYQIIQLQNENQHSGLGRFGDFETEVGENEFLLLVKEKFSLSVIRHSPFLGKPIKRVGVLGGSGASGIAAAKSQNCDAYLTGDIKYHDFFQSESQILICDIGHFESEQFVTQQLFELLSEKFTKFAVLKSEINTNPVNYFL